MFKAYVILSLVLVGSIANADATYLVKGKQATKVEALLALIKDKNAEVYKCQAQEITDKATMKSKSSKQE